jgi:hypothetical protein
MIQKPLNDAEWNELDDYDRMDCVCDWFEQSLRLGQKPSPAVFAALVPTSVRSAALNALLQLQQVYEEAAREGNLRRSVSPTVSLCTTNEETDFEVLYQKRETEDFEAEARLPIAFGSYVLKELLGSGSFGDVFLGQRVGTDHEYAIKVPRPKLLNSDDDKKIFIREARHASGLDHPNIVRAFDSGQCAKTPYIAYEYVRGITLREYLLRIEKLDDDVIIDLMAKLADAVAYAHEQGIVHRDLKPGNVLLKFEHGVPDNPTPETKLIPKLSDFGISKRINSNTLATMPGEFLGTPAYSSPEQAQGNSRKVVPASDVYSLGVILHELLVGETPFVGQPVFILKQIAGSEVPSVLKGHPNVNRDLATICEKALRLDPAHRYQKAEDFAEDLRRVQRFEPILARPVGALERTVLWVKRHPQDTSWALVAVVLLLAVGGLIANAVMAPANDLRPLLAREGMLQQAVSSELPLEDWIRRLPSSAADPLPFMARLDDPFNARQIQLLAASLRPHNRIVVPLIEKSYFGMEGLPDKQAPLACMLGLLGETSELHDERADMVAVWLVRSEVSHDKQACLDVLRKFKEGLVPSIMHLACSAVNRVERSNARDLLFPMLDRSTVDSTVALLKSVEPTDFIFWRDELTAYRDEATEAISNRLEVLGTVFTDDTQGESQTQEVGNLMLMAAGLDRLDLPAKHLASTTDPRPGVYFMHQLADTSFSMDPLVDRVHSEADSRLIYHLLTGLGFAKQEQLSTSSRKQLESWVRQTYQKHPHAGVHSACRWLLKRWGATEEIQAMDRELAQHGPSVDREWYVDPIGLTMRIFRNPVPVAFLKSTPDPKNRSFQTTWYESTLNYNFAVSTEELTIESLAGLIVNGDEVEAETKSVSTDSSPITFADLADTLRKLNDRVGIASDEQVVTPVDEEYWSVDRTKLGYRLPSNLEWHAICRGDLHLESFHGTYRTGFLERYENESVPSPAGMFDLVGKRRELTFSNSERAAYGIETQPNLDIWQVRLRTAFGAYGLARSKSAEFFVQESSMIPSKGISKTLAIRLTRSIASEH